MKRHAAALFIILTVFPLMVARTQTVVVGGGAMYHLPVGSLADRFRGATGVMAYAGQRVGSDWTWVGKVDYFELNKLNTDKLVKNVKVQTGNTTQYYVFPLPLLAMKLKATGFMAEAKYNFLQLAVVESNVNFGFGFTHWENFRSAYYDSLFIDTSRTTPGTRMNVATLAVPESRQNDWSGTVSLGLEANLRLLPPVWITLGADYKLIIGELWQTLALDLENVSGMHFVTARAGLKIDL